MENLTQEAMDLMKKGFIQQRVYGTKYYEKETELLTFAKERMSSEEAEKQFKEFKVKSL